MSESESRSRIWGFTSHKENLSATLTAKANFWSQVVERVDWGESTLKAAWVWAHTYAQTRFPDLFSRGVHECYYQDRSGIRNGALVSCFSTSLLHLRVCVALPTPIVKFTNSHTFWESAPRFPIENRYCVNKNQCRRVCVRVRVQGRFRRSISVAQYANKRNQYTIPSMIKSFKL